MRVDILRFKLSKDWTSIYLKQLFFKLLSSFDLFYFFTVCKRNSVLIGFIHIHFFSFEFVYSIMILTCSHKSITLEIWIKSIPKIKWKKNLIEVFSILFISYKNYVTFLNIWLIGKRLNNKAKNKNKKKVLFKRKVKVRNKN